MDGEKITRNQAQKRAERPNKLKNKFEAQKIEQISSCQGRCYQNLSLRLIIIQYELYDCFFLLLTLTYLTIT